MGLLYLNIINTLLKSNNYDNSLIFSICSNVKYDVLYSISLERLFKYLNVKNSVVFKQPSCEFTKTFNVIVDGSEKTIRLAQLVNISKEIIKFNDNKDLPIGNKKTMHHSPFIIYNNHNIKLPKSNILKFDMNCKLMESWEVFKNTSEKHAGYNLITPCINELTTIDLNSMHISSRSFAYSQNDVKIFMKLIRC